MADAQRQVVEVCSYYHKNKDLLDRLAAQAGTVPATSGIMIALQKKKRSCPLAKRSTVQRWWKNRWWALSADERKRVGKGRPTFLTSRQELTLAHFLLMSARLGAALLTSEIKSRARWLAKANGHNIKGCARLDDWLRGFVKRTNEQRQERAEELVFGKKRGKKGKRMSVLKIRRRGSALSSARAASLNESSISSFEKVVEQMLADNPSLAIDDIGNFDEFQLDLHASLMKIGRAHV